MPAHVKSQLPHPKIFAAVLAALAIALIVAGGASAGQTGKQTKRVAGKSENATLGKVVLTTTGGRTLYSLSAETSGRFICTGSCLASWHPLTVPVGTRPTGPVRLNTIARPDGHGLQVTYRGKPLYRFVGDSKAGDANGEGIKDVGTWHAAAVPQSQSAEPPPKTPTVPYPPSYPPGEAVPTPPAETPTPPYPPYPY